MRGALFGCVLLVACQGGPLAADAGTDAWPVMAEPAPPMLTPCPPGWREMTDAQGVTTCDPWPTDGYHGADCAWDEAHFAGMPGCARIGPACPADGWPSDLPTDRVIVHVDDDAAPGGDGASRATAYQQIGDAILAAPAGAVIAVATGRYDEAIRVPNGTTLWGACVDGTRITTTVPSDTEAALTLAGDGAGARNVGVDTAARVGVIVAGATDTVLAAVVIDSARLVGLYASGAALTATDLVVRGTRPAANGTLGRGIDVEPGTELTLARALLDDNREAGLSAAGDGASVDASDLVVRGTRADADGRFGRGIDVDGATLTLARALVEDNRQQGLYIISIGTTVHASDLVVRGTRERADGSLGRGIEVQPGGALTLARTLLDDNRGTGLFVEGASTMVQADDLVVRGTREQRSDGTFGRGVVVGPGAAVTLARVILDDNRDTGLIASGSAAIVQASDLVVRGTRERSPEGTGGRGLEAQNGAAVMLARTLVDDNRDTGFYVEGANTSVRASGLVIRSTAPRSADRAYGNGLWAQRDAQVVWAGGLVEASSLAGVTAVQGANVQLTDVSVRGVGASACDPTVFPACSGDLGGFGLVAIFGGILSASHFSVEDASLCGVLVGEDSRLSFGATALDLVSGTVSSTMIGACVQVDGYDTARLTQDVDYRDVRVPLQATSFMLPMALPSGT